MWFTTFIVKNLTRRPLRSLLTAFAVAIGCRAGLVGRDAAVEAVGRHRIHPERLVHPAEEVVRREVAVLELLAVRTNLVVDELAHCIAHHLELFGPFEHGRIVRDRTTWTSRPRAECVILRPRSPGFSRLGGKPKPWARET